MNKQKKGVKFFIYRFDFDKFKTFLNYKREEQKELSRDGLDENPISPVCFIDKMDYSIFCELKNEWSIGMTIEVVPTKWSLADTIALFKRDMKEFKILWQKVEA